MKFGSRDVALVILVLVALWLLFYKKTSLGSVLSSQSGPPTFEATCVCPPAYTFAPKLPIKSRCGMNGPDGKPVFVSEMCVCPTGYKMQEQGLGIACVPR